MDILIYFGIFVGALILLLKSSDFFVDKAERIGLSFGISHFIIGVTIVAFGTSLPELATSIVSVLDGKSEIVGGTVVGSNITNILLVLGATLLVGKSIKLEHNIWDLDMPMLIISALFTWFALSNEGFCLFEAILFCLGLVFFLMSCFKNEQTSPSLDETIVKAKGLDYIILILAGAGVSFGAKYTVFAISNLSEIAGIPADIISLSVVALGTSLPEVMVSVAAARKGKSAIAVGNILGSNIFNTYGVLGIARLFGPLAFSQEIISMTVPFMVAITVLFGFVCISGRINKWLGAMMILLYVYYMSTLV